AEAARYAREVVCDVEESGIPWDVIIANLAMGRVSLAQGDAASAIAALERGQAVCEAAGIPYLLPAMASHLSQAYLLAGRPAEAVRLAERAVAQSHGRVQARAFRLVHLSDAYLHVGRGDDARAAAEQAVAEARARHERGYEVRALRLLGDVAAHA